MLDVTQSDLNNINALITGLQNNDLTGLQDSNGNLLNPVPNLTSSVLTRGALLSEVGVSLAREFSPGGHALEVGITPKFMRVDTFDYKMDADTADITIDQGKKSYSTANFDLGARLRQQLEDRPGGEGPGGEKIHHRPRPCHRDQAAGALGRGLCRPGGHRGFGPGPDQNAGTGLDAAGHISPSARN